MDFDPFWCVEKINKLIPFWRTMQDGRLTFKMTTGCFIIKHKALESMHWSRVPTFFTFISIHHIVHLQASLCRTFVFFFVIWCTFRF